MHGAIGDLNGLYGYSATEYGTAFGQYSAGQVNITTDPTNGFRIRAAHDAGLPSRYQRASSGRCQPLRAGTGNDTVGIIGDGWHVATLRRRRDAGQRRFSGGQNGKTLRDRGDDHRRSRRGFAGFRWRLADWRRRQVELDRSRSKAA